MTSQCIKHFIFSALNQCHRHKEDIAQHAEKLSETERKFSLDSPNIQAQPILQIKSASSKMAASNYSSGWLYNMLFSIAGPLFSSSNV